MRKHNSLADMRFGKLVAQVRVSNCANGEPQYECICDCGNTSVVRATLLRRGLIKSCGCRKGNHIHGRSYSSEHNIWRAMKQRCHNANDTSFYMYGAKGITVCESWHKFENFFADMGERPSPKHSIDRIDGTKGYYKENCRWATATEQSRNRLSNRFISFMGKTQCLAAWAEELGIPSYSFQRHLDRCSSVDEGFKLLADKLRVSDIIGLAK